MAEAIVHARRQKLIDDLGWLFISDAQDVAVNETSELVGQDEEVARGSANVHCILGRESANLIVLEGAARSSADVHFVLGRVG